MKNRVSVFSVVLYVLAFLFFVFTIVVFYQNLNYVTELISQGQLLVAGSEYDLVKFFVSDSGTYLFYALVLLAAGWIIQKATNIQERVSVNYAGVNEAHIEKIIEEKARQNLADQEIEDLLNEDSDIKKEDGSDGSAN